MARKADENRKKILEAANRLFYERGYAATSFSDIAEAAAFNRGNFYHYFKSKDDILDAVVAQRAEGVRALLAAWDAEYPAPLDRLIRFTRMPLTEYDNALRFGCPMGTLNSELGKMGAPYLAKSRVFFDLFRDWLEAQFHALGCGARAAGYAERMLVETQGATMLAHVYGDAAPLEAAVARLQGWLRGLPGAGV